MTGWVAAFNLVCSMFYDGLVLVAGPLGKAFQAGLVGLLVGGVATVVFKRLINLPRLRSSQQLLLAALYESWLYRHEPRVVLVANGALLKANFAYLRTFLVPLAVGSLLVTPMVLMAPQSPPVFMQSLKTHLALAPTKPSWYSQLEFPKLLPLPQLLKRH